MWSPFRRRDEDLSEEIGAHLAMARQDRLDRGESAEEAAQNARQEFGNELLIRETTRDVWKWINAETALQDLRYALRTLRKNPRFAIASMAILALAIGANTAMFSVLNAVLFRPLPYPSPDRLAMLWTERPDQNLQNARSAYWNVEQWREQSKSFADVAVWDGVSTTLTGTDYPEHINVVRVSPSLFSLLGVQPLEGRVFSATEAEQRRRVSLIGYRFWQSHFGGSQNALGASIEIDGRPSRIIGILPGGSQTILSGADVCEPHTLFPDWEARRQVRGTDSWFVLGRLRANVTIGQAQAEMSAVARRLDEQMPASERNLGIRVVPLSLQVTGPSARRALWLLSGAVFCVLLIAATNIAGLYLARGARREKEIAIRAALGATRARIVRQLLAESVTLAVLSGMLGLFVAEAGIHLILAIEPGNLARLNEVRLDPRAVVCALALCLFTGIVAGLAPAVALARRNSVSPSGKQTRGIRGGLVVAEFALAMILLTGAGLLIRSLWSIQRVDPGFKPDSVLSMNLVSPAAAPAQLAGIYDRALQRIQALPGVTSAGIIGEFFIGGNTEQILTGEGSGKASMEPLRVRRDEVSPGFFQAAGTPLLGGRFFTDADGPGSPRVAIVNEALARRVWPGRDPAGRKIRLGGAVFTVVGVVADMHRQGLETEAIPQFFEPLAQNPSRHETLLVRTSTGGPLKMAGAVEAAVHQTEKQVLVSRGTTLDDRLGGLLAARQFQTSLLIGFAVVALLLAAIGIYGLIQYSTAARMHEIGIRVAVGARPSGILRMIMLDSLKLSLAGLALGLVGAFWLSRAVSSFLFGITGTDPLTYIAVSVLLAAAAAAACYFPARRAMSADPMTALRQE
ncbi:MAG TPA: ABC transporter permease [Bryobacteraceae bacterium]|nr:ABC transporter permease [Bryobacteraceae bacterium]